MADPVAEKIAEIDRLRLRIHELEAAADAAASAEIMAREAGRREFVASLIARYQLDQEHDAIAPDGTILKGHH